MKDTIRITCFICCSLPCEVLFLLAEIPVSMIYLLAIKALVHSVVVLELLVRIVDTKRTKRASMKKDKGK